MPLRVLPVVELPVAVRHLEIGVLVHTKASVTKALYETGAFAVVCVPAVERGCEIAEGLIKGDVHAMEISYTLPNAGEVIAGIKERFGDEMIVGAGTIMEATTARLAIMSGASSSWPT